MTHHSIEADGLRVRVAAFGAELQSVQAAGVEMLWQAGPEWPRHAPNLFPIVGELTGGVLRHQGREYKMGRHGFARDRVFAWAERSAAACRLVLEDDAATRAMYPFPFRLEIGYAIADGVLAVTYEVTNTGAQVLPASVGAHPAFNWPLRVGVAKTAHVVRFARPEPAPIRRIAGNLLLAERFASPVVGDTLALDEALFGPDAVIMDQLASRSLTYTAPGGPALEVAWDGFVQLGLWMRPGADFLCIEPWLGMASPADFDGEFMDKPGLAMIAPQDVLRVGYQLRVRT